MSSRTISIPVPVPGSRTGWLATGLALGAFAAILAGPLLQTRHALAVDPTSTTPEHTISVSGTGHIVLSPDTADRRRREERCLSDDTIVESLSAGGTRIGRRGRLAAD